MLNFRFIILFVLAGTISKVASTQSPSYLMETFGSRNGLLSSKIYSLAQASDRKLWIGTELGLSVYNGYEFINYQYTAEHATIGRVLSITEDRLKGIWIGGDKG